MSTSKISLEDALDIYKNLNSLSEDKITTFRSIRNLVIKDYPGMIDTDSLKKLLQSLIVNIESIVNSSGFDVTVKNGKLKVVPKEYGAEDILAVTKNLCDLYVSLFDVVLESGIPFSEILSLYFKYKTIEIFRSNDCDLSYDLDEKILDLLNSI